MAASLHELKRRVVLAPDDPEARLALAEALLADARPADAATQLEAVLALAPQRTDARRMLARAYLSDGRPVPSERTLREGIRLAPERSELRDALAEAMETLDRLDDALLQLQEADRLSPDDLRRLEAMAGLFRRTRRLERARSALEAATRMAPDRTDLAARLAEVITELGGTPERPDCPLDRGPDFLLGRTREALESPPIRGCAQGPLRDAAVAVRRGDLRAARRALVLAGSEGGVAFAAHWLRGEVLLAEGARDKAESAYRRAVESDTSAEIAWERLGEILLARRAAAEAAEAFGRAAAGEPASLSALVGLGDALALCGRRDEAVAAYERALGREPGGPAAARLALLRSAEHRSESQTRSSGRIGALGWSATGGTVSPIEAVAVPGKGELLFSGNVGPVGQEAAKVAYSCLKARAGELGVAERLSQHDLHLHFADTEIAKDGPSAGLALALAGLSALTDRPLRPALAATGEVTLGGGVKAVGGLHEKLVAACLDGVKTALVPRRNLLDTRELPPEVTSRLGLVYVDSLREAADAAFLPA
jgi:ATP-dependent Lon protease